MYITDVRLYKSHLPNHKSSILQDQASPKLIEWVNNYIVSHSTHMMHITK